MKSNLRKLLTVSLSFIISAGAVLPVHAEDVFPVASETPELSGQDRSNQILNANEDTGGLSEFNGHYYFVYTSGRSSWDATDNYIKGLGGYMAIIESEEENAFVYNLMKNAGKSDGYFGYSDQASEGNWLWVDGTAGSYTNWHSGEPNGGTSENYAMFYSGFSDGTWNDGSFSSSNAVIAEWNSLDDYMKITPEEFGGHYYHVYGAGLVSTWQGAKAYCENLGGHLAVIDSSAENIFLYNMMIDNGYDTAYFGYTDEQTEGTWLWCDGSAGTYENWHSGEPNNDGEEDYAEFYWMFTDGTWNDGNFGHGTGSDVTAFIAEWDSQNSYSYAAQNYTSAARLMKFNFMDGSDSVLKRTSGIDHVNMNYNGQDQTVEGTNVEVPYLDSLTDFIFTKDGYRDYIVPEEVIESLKYESISHASPYLVAHIMDIYMNSKLGDGKSYISSVYGRVKGNSRYIDLVNNKMQLNENENQEIIVSAAGSDRFVKYVISQDDSHKIESATGKFDACLFDQLDFDKDVFAYAVDSAGNTTELKKIKLEKNDENLAGYSKTLNFLEGGSYSIISNQSIAFDTDLSLLQKASFAMDVFDVPFSFEINERKVRISFGLDFFNGGNSTEQYDDGPKNKYNQWTDFKKGIKELVNLKNDLGKDAKEVFKDKFDEAKKKYRNTRDLYKLYENNGIKKIKSSSKDWKAKVYGYMEGEIVDWNFVITEGALLLDGELKYSHTMQHIAGFIPWYTRFGFGGSLSIPLLAGKRSAADSAVPFELNGTIGFTPEAQLAVGLGIDKLTKAGVYGKGTAPFTLQIPSKKFRIDLTGEIGVELQWWFLRGNIVFWSGETNLVDKVLGSGKNENGAQIASEEPVWSVMDRSYLEQAAVVLNHTVMMKNSNSDGTAESLETLYESVFSGAQPKIVTYGDKMIAFWINDDGTRDEYNRMELVYSVYDGYSWSEIKSVYDDEHNDSSPVAVSDGENVYVAWQKISETLTEETSTPEMILKSSELWLAQYDEQTDSFNAQRVSENENYEYEHALSINEGGPVLYYMTCIDNNLAGAGNNTLSVYQNGKTNTIAENLNRAAYVSASSGKSVYIIDADGDYTDASDLCVYEVGDGKVADITETYRSEDTGTFLSSAYEKLDGAETLFISDSSNIYYANNGEIKKVFETERAISADFKVIQSNGETYIIWAETDGIYDELFYTKYQDGSWNTPVQATAFERKLGNIDVCNYNGQIIVVMNDTEMIIDEENETVSNGATNLSMYRLTDFTDIEISANNSSFNEAEAIPGQQSVLGVTVFNRGSIPVHTVEFHVTDELGTDLSETVEVDIPVGDSQYVEVPYQVPETYSKTVITVEAITDNDRNTDNNKAEIHAGLVDLTIQNRDVVECYDGYVIKSLIENRSLVNAENVSFELYAGSMDSAPLDIQSVAETMGNDSYYDMTTVLFTENLQFDETGYCPVYLHVFSDSQESSDGDNWDTVYVKKQKVSLSLNQSEITLAKGRTTALTAIVYPERLADNITWSSSDDTVVSVDENGFVTAVNEGTAVITASLKNGIKAQATVTVIDNSVSIYGSSLNLSGKIGINTYLDIPEEFIDQMTVVMEMNGKETRIPASKGVVRTISGIDYRMYEYPVTAKEMRDKVTLKVEDAEGNPVKLIKEEEDYTEGYPYSATDYFARAEEAGAEKTKKLSRVLNNYGKYAQIYFDYHVTDEVLNTTDVSQVTKETLAPYQAVQTSTEVAGLTYVGGSTMLDDMIGYRLYFKVGTGYRIESYRFTIDGKKVTPVKSGSQYYIEKTDIAAKDLGNKNMIEVTDGKTAFGIQYCALSYAYRALELTGEDRIPLQNMCRAMYLYNQQAIEYFEN